MAIKTSTFGGVTLTGDAAKAFKKQFLDPKIKSNPLAQSSLEKGRQMLKELCKKGYIMAKPSKPTSPNKLMLHHPHRSERF